MGVPVLTVEGSDGAGGIEGYRVAADDYALPGGRASPPTSSPCSASPPGSGSRPASARRPRAPCASSRRSATARSSTDRSASRPAIATAEPSFPVLLDAVRSRRTVVFDYRKPGDEPRAARRRSRGASPPGAATGTSSGTTATAAAPACSASRASWATPSASGQPGAVRGARRRRRRRHDRGVVRRRRRRDRHRRGSASRRARPRTAAPRARATRAADVLERRLLRRRGRSRASSWAWVPTSWRSRPSRCATPSYADCASRRGRARHERRSRPTPRPPASRGCWRSCRGSAPTRASRSTRPPRTSASPSTSCRPTSGCSSCTGRPGHMPGDLVDIQFWDEDRRHPRHRRADPRPPAAALARTRPRRCSWRCACSRQVPGPHDRGALASATQQARGRRRARRSRPPTGWPWPVDAATVDPVVGDRGEPGAARGPAAAHRLRRGARRAHRARRRPDAGPHARRPHLPRGLVPPRRGRAHVPPRPHRCGRRPRRRGRGARPTPPRSTSAPARCAPRAPRSPSRSPRRSPGSPRSTRSTRCATLPDGRLRSSCPWPTSAGWSGSCCAPAGPSRCSTGPTSSSGCAPRARRPGGLRRLLRPRSRSAASLGRVTSGARGHPGWHSSPVRAQEPPGILPTPLPTVRENRPGGGSRWPRSRRPARCAGTSTSPRARCGSASSRRSTTIVLAPQLLLRRARVPRPTSRSPPTPRSSACCRPPVSAIERVPVPAEAREHHAGRPLGYDDLLDLVLFLESHDTLAEPSMAPPPLGR